MSRGRIGRQDGVGGVTDGRLAVTLQPLAHQEEPGSEEQLETLLLGANLQFWGEGRKSPSSCESQLSHSAGRESFSKHRRTPVLPFLRHPLPSSSIGVHRPVPASFSTSSQPPPLCHCSLQPHSLLLGPPASLSPRIGGSRSRVPAASASAGILPAVGPSGSAPAHRRQQLGVGGGGISLSSTFQADWRDRFQPLSLERASPGCCRVSHPLGLTDLCFLSPPQLFPCSMDHNWWLQVVSSAARLCVPHEVPGSVRPGATAVT